MKIGSAKHKPESAGKAGMPGQSESGGYCTMGETLMQRRRVEEEGLRIVNSCC